MEINWTMIGAIGQWFAGFTTLAAVLLSLYYSQKLIRPIASVSIRTLGDIESPTTKFFLVYLIKNVGGATFYLKNCEVELKNHIEYTKHFKPYIIDSMIVPGNYSEALLDIGYLLIGNEKVFHENKLRLTLYDYSGNKFMSDWYDLEKAIEHFNNMREPEANKNGEE